MNTTVDKMFWTVFPSSLGWMAAWWKGSNLGRLTFGHSSGQAAIRSIQLGCGCEDLLEGMLLTREQRLGPGSAQIREYLERLEQP